MRYLPKVKKYLKRIDIFLLLSLSIFAILLSPFLFVIPYLDGGTDFLQTYSFYTGGFTKYFHTFNSVHPPFKFWIVDIFFTFFGIHTFSYNITGLLFGLLGILFLYFLAKALFNTSVARLSTTLFAISPLYLATSLFVMRDFFLTSLLLPALYFYSKKKHFLYAIVASLLVLIKETALVFPVAIFIVELFYIKQLIHNKKKLQILFFLCFPLLVFLGWLSFLHLIHQNSWNDWLFTPTAKKGTFYTVAYNLITLHLFNVYAYEQWRHLFIFNFHWVYWIVLLIGVAVLFLYRRPTRAFLCSGEQNLKTILVIILFSLAYIFSVLTIQTYTITRYIVPLMPLLLLGVSWSISLISRYRHGAGLALTSVVFIISILSLFFSVDPLSSMLWGKTTIFNQKLYNVFTNLSGPDAIEYNLQYLMLARTRSSIISSPAAIAIESTDCNWLKNSNEVLAILQMPDFSIPTICL